MSSLLNWLSKANPALCGAYKEPKYPFLSNPNEETTDKNAAACAAASEEIVKIVKVGEGSRKRRGQYKAYDHEQRAKMAKYASQHGLMAASRYFSSGFGHNVPYTSIQSMLKEYRGRLKAVRDPTKIISLPHTHRGRPVLLPADIDARVQKHLLAIRKSGGGVNRRIAIVGAGGMVIHST